MLNSCQQYQAALKLELFGFRAAVAYVRSVIGGCLTTAETIVNGLTA